jgi:uncharacterized membrane protein YkvA (DUF1232 family)
LLRWDGGIIGRATPLIAHLKAWAKALKLDVAALYLALRYPRTPWPAKAVALLVVAYALSPIDLIPDFIPVLGYLDDLILLPLGIALAIRLIPAPLMAELRARAEQIPANRLSIVGAIVIVVLWIALAGVALKLLVHQAS